MAFTTAAVVALATSVYRGPSRDRLSLAAAHAAQVLVFSVNRSHLDAPIGGPEVLGYYETIEEAAAALVAVKDQVPAGGGRPFGRISAHHRGYGYTEECVLYCGWWKPLGELPAELSSQLAAV